MSRTDAGLHSKFQVDGIRCEIVMHGLKLKAMGDALSPVTLAAEWLSEMSVDIMYKPRD